MPNSWVRLWHEMPMDEDWALEQMDLVAARPAEPSDAECALLLMEIAAADSDMEMFWAEVAEANA